MTPGNPQKGKESGSDGKVPQSARKKRNRSTSNAALENEDASNAKHSTNAATANDSTTDHSMISGDGHSNLSTIQFNLSQESNVGMPLEFSEPFPTNLQFRSGIADESTMDGYSTNMSQATEDSRLNVSNGDSRLPDTISRMQLNLPASSSSGGVSELVTVPAPAVNPFLENSVDPIRPVATRKSFAPSRYMLDFEEEYSIGEGMFSKVVCARNRIDGVQYALKKLKGMAYSDNQTRRLTKEICALAVLQGCPQIVRYFSSWIDEEGRVYIQTELCGFGSLDVFVTGLGLGGHGGHVSAEAMMRADMAARHIASRGRSLSAASNNSSTFSRASSLSVDVGAGAMMIDSSAAGAGFEPPPCTPKPLDSSTPTFGIPLPPLAQRQQPPVAPAQAHAHVQAPPALFGSSSSSRRSPLVAPSPVVVEGINEALGWLILYEMSQALAYMHSKHMAHMDVRPGNMFITSGTGVCNMSQSQFALPDMSGTRAASSGGSISTGSLSSINSTGSDPQDPKSVEIACLLSGQHKIKLGDFGHAVSTVHVNVHDLEEGDSRYCSREVMEAQSNLDLTLADIFSLGASVYELCLGRPIQGENDEFHDIRNGILENSFAHGSSFSSAFVETILKLLSPVPTMRPRAAELREQTALRIPNNQS